MPLLRERARLLLKPSKMFPPLNCRLPPLKSSSLRRWRERQATAIAVVRAVAAKNPNALVSVVASIAKAAPDTAAVAAGTAATLLPRQAEAIALAAAKAAPTAADKIAAAVAKALPASAVRVAEIIAASTPATSAKVFAAVGEAVPEALPKLVSGRLAILFCAHNSSAADSAGGHIIETFFGPINGGRANHSELR